MQRLMRHILSGLLLAACTGMVGCGSSGPPVVPVSGQVTFGGGPPPASGTINFMMRPGTGLAGMPNRPGTASFGKDGKFEVSSYSKGDGLLPGTYTAAVICYVGTPNEGNPQSFIDLNAAPQDFAPELVVEPGSRAIVKNFDVPKKKK
jgi:hypothetical protein